MANKDEENKLEKQIRTSYIEGGSKMWKLIHSYQIWKKSEDIKCHYHVKYICKHLR